MIKWDDSLATGIKEIDNQHKSLISRIEILLNSCQTTTHMEKSKEMIEFLEEYVVKHFISEETIQKACDYPEYNLHKMEHEKFLKDFAKLKEKILNEGLSLGIRVDINHTVVQWLNKHIRIADKKLADYIKSTKKSGIL